MERAVVVGNCQALALELILATSDAFARRFELVRFPAVHLIPDEEIRVLHRAVADAALVLPQRVDEGYRDGIGLGTETLAHIAGPATVVRWPSVYWAGYVPDLFYLRDEAGAVVVDAPFDYHDRTILEAYAEGASVRATCELLADPDRPSEAPTWAERATAELALRGRDCDVDVAAFIAERHREQLLFHTMNHPANALLGQLADQVLELLGLPGGVDLARVPGEMLGSTFYPLHANHARALALAFADDRRAGRAPFTIRGVTYEAPEAIASFFGYYDAHPQHVAHNRAVASA